MQILRFVFACALSSIALTGPAFCADWKLATRPVQFHGFVTQGFAYSDTNNFLTMTSNQGSFRLTDGGANVSMLVTDRLRVGGQVYAYSVGDLGKGRPELDWAYADYRVRDWFGIRAGKVKTPLGLYNDTQDMQFLHTWALLPLGAYPVDRRSSTIAHKGGDIYGSFPVRRVGSFSYQAYVGRRAENRRSGYFYSLEDYGLPPKEITGWASGADLRWESGLKGLMLGGSFFRDRLDALGTVRALGSRYGFTTPKSNTWAAYSEYAVGNLRMNGEYRREISVRALSGLQASSFYNDTRAWFVSGAYRLVPRLEVGSYYSYYVPQYQLPTKPPGNHIGDVTVAGRIDITPYWSTKIEGHFIDGYGLTFLAHGFYIRGNPGGLNPKMKLLVVRTGFNF